MAARPGPLRPIWQRPGRPPAAGAGRGKALWLNLHAKSGVVADMEYLVFGDARMGWRMGLPAKFSVRINGDEVVVRPTDRTWINRPHDEAGDGGAPAIWTFWYGYNSKIYDRKLMGQGLPVNYTERLNLWILQWVRGYYLPDPHRWYCSGSSMGGCGTISFGLRHPELFAGLHAHVPIVAYTYLGRGSAHRCEPSCWVGTIPAALETDEGLPFVEHLDGTKFVRQCPDDLPPLFLINGRTDASIPWENNPAFYRTLNDAHQAFAVYWDNGDHATCGKDAPADIKGWLTRFRRLRGDQSYPAFSNTSSNRNPGSGKPADGDPIGWMNRGMDWQQIDDRPERYAITVLADYPGIAYPVGPTSPCGGCKPSSRRRETSCRPRPTAGRNWPPRPTATGGSRCRACRLPRSRARGSSFAECRNRKGSRDQEHRLRTDALNCSMHWRNVSRLHGSRLPLETPLRTSKGTYHFPLSSRCSEVV